MDTKDGGSGSTTVNVNYTTTYSFGGWNTNSSGTGTTYSAGSSFTYNGNQTMYAKWSSHSSTTGGNKVSLPVVNAVTGYNFNGWYNENGTREGDSGGLSATTFQSGATINASWSAKKYPSVVYYKLRSDDSELFPAKTGEVTYGTTWTETAPQKNGYKVDGPSTQSKAVQAEVTNTMEFKYIYQDNYLQYDLGQYGFFPSEYLQSYNLGSGNTDPATGKKFVVLPVPQIKAGYEQWSFVG